MLIHGNTNTSWGLDPTRGADDDWHTRAACAEPTTLNAAQLDADAWTVYDIPNRSNRAAAQVCKRICPVRDACLAWYQRQPEQFRSSVIAGGMHFNVEGQPRPIRDPRDIPRDDWVTGDPDDQLTPSQAGYLADAATRTIVDACRAGALPARQSRGGHWHIRRADLHDWITRVAELMHEDSSAQPIEPRRGGRRPGASIVDAVPHFQAGAA